jgi:hypothetical protein
VKDYVTPAPYVNYEADGTIIAAGRCGIGFIADRIAAGERVLIAQVPLVAGEVGAARYVDVATRSLREKTPCPARLEGLTLQDLPLPCRIEISTPEGAPAVYPETEAAEIDLTFDHPGTYSVRVLSAPHLAGAFTVVAS